MCSHVHQMRGHLSERFPTNNALVWLLSGVGPDVCRESAFVVEFPVTIFTLKWIVAGVLSRVIIVRLRVDKGCITIFALVRSFTSMLPATEKPLQWRYETMDSTVKGIKLTEYVLCMVAIVGSACHIGHCE